MREIKFRGKSVDTGEWIHGDLKQYEGMCFICDPNSPTGFVKVDPATVGQLTGLRDKKCLDVYEGDIVTCSVRSSGPDDEPIPYARGEVKYVDGIGWNFAGWGSGWCNNVEVIGNIHENPELMDDHA